MILALSGRRIDPPGAYPARFPLMNGELVRERIRNLLKKHAVTAIVCSVPMMKPPMPRRTRPSSKTLKYLGAPVARKSAPY